MTPDEPTRNESVEGLPTERLLEMMGTVVRGVLETREVMGKILAELRRRELSWDRIFAESQIPRELAEATLGANFSEQADLIAGRNT